MAAMIMVIPKKSPKIEEFFDIVDNYITKQGMKKLSDIPKIYFTEGSATQASIRSLISTIKTTKWYNSCVQKIFFSHNLGSV